jgi:hypothetical protein
MTSFQLENENLLLSFILSSAGPGGVIGGISISSIYDNVLRYEYLTEGPTSLFAYAIDNGPLILSSHISDGSVIISNVTRSDDGTRLVIPATIASNRVEAQLTITMNPGDAAALLLLELKNVSRKKIFLRLVFPKIRGLKSQSGLTSSMGAVPQEIGSVKPLVSAPYAAPIPDTKYLHEFKYLGVPLNRYVGLPTGMNTIEVASVYDGALGGGVFFADVDGNLDNGLSPIQFSLFLNESAAEVTGFWITGLEEGTVVPVPRLAIGVHHEGDWHKAVDYVRQHCSQRNFLAAPSWLKDQGAIYCFSGGGAGGVYLESPIANINDGAIWTSFVVDDRWHPQPREPYPIPLPITRAGLAPAGAHVCAIKRDDHQLDLFVVANDGSIKTFYVIDDARWHPDPIQLSDIGFAEPEAHLATICRSSEQLDLFVVDKQGALRTTFVTRKSDGRWNEWHSPRSLPDWLSANNLAPSGAPLSAVLRDEGHLDLFVVGVDGSIWTTYVRRGIDGRWGKWHPPLSLPGTSNLAVPGAHISALKRNERQLDVFVPAKDQTIWTTYVVGHSAWHESPVPLPGTIGRASKTGGIAAVKRNERQLDVFYIGIDGAVWTTFSLDHGEAPWHPEPIRLPVQLQEEPPEKPLNLPDAAQISAIKRNEKQLDLFVVNHDGAIWTTFVLDIGKAPWHPKWIRLTHQNHAPAGAHMTAIKRSSRQADVFLAAKGRITSFFELPNLLDEAERLGTNILYLHDYWEGAQEGGLPPYWNKGDYCPRSDLGGAPAFNAGISAIHRRKGKVILYLEPFIVLPESKVGKEIGQRIEAWDFKGSTSSHRPADALPDDVPYSYYYKMVPWNLEWQFHIEKIAVRLVQEHGADGIFLDSWGWQWNWPWAPKNSDDRTRIPEQHAELSLRFNKGVLALADRVRNAIQSIPRETVPVVLAETISGPLAAHIHGGFSADFAFRRNSNEFPTGDSKSRIMGSPVRYGMPEINYFTSGLDLNELHQTYAAGHGLALCANWEGTWIHTNELHIRKLVKIRQEYKDALIYGQQKYQPATGNDAVAAYFYQGTMTEIMTVVNTSKTVYSGSLQLDNQHVGSSWLDLLSTSDVFAATGSLLSINIPPQWIRILRKTRG